MIDETGNVGEGLIHKGLIKEKKNATKANNIASNNPQQVRGQKIREKIGVDFFFSTGGFAGLDKRGALSFLEAEMAGDPPMNEGLVLWDI